MPVFRSDVLLIYFNLCKVAFDSSLVEANRLFFVQSSDMQQMGMDGHRRIETIVQAKEL